MFSPTVIPGCPSRPGSPYKMNQISLCLSASATQTDVTDKQADLHIVDFVCKMLS